MLNVCPLLQVQVPFQPTDFRDTDDAGPGGGGGGGIVQVANFEDHLHVHLTFLQSFACLFGLVKRWKSHIWLKSDYVIFGKSTIRCLKLGLYFIPNGDKNPNHPPKSDAFCLSLTKCCPVGHYSQLDLLKKNVFEFSSSFSIFQQHRKKKYVQLSSSKKLIPKSTDHLSRHLHRTSPAFSGMRSLEGRVSSRLSSMTLFMDSIQLASKSPHADIWRWRWWSGKWRDQKIGVVCCIFCWDIWYTSCSCDIKLQKKSSWGSVELQFWLTLSSKVKRCKKSRVWHNM